MSDDVLTDAKILERIRSEIDERDGMTLVEVTEELADEVRLVVRDPDHDAPVAYRVVSEPRVDGEEPERLRWIRLGDVV